jgi:hypothetical protein
MLLFDGDLVESFPRNICGFGDSSGDEVYYDSDYPIVNGTNSSVSPSERC